MTYSDNVERPSPLSVPRYQAAGAALLLVVLGIVASFLTWRTIDASFTFEGGDGSVTGSLSGVSGEATAQFRGETLPSTAGANPLGLILFVLLAAIGTGLIAAGKAPKVGAVLTTLSGVILAAWAAVVMSQGPDLFLATGVDGTFGEFNREAAEQATMSTGTGAYLAILVGLLTIGLGFYEFARLGRAAAPSVPVAPAWPTQQPPALGQYSNPGAQPQYPGQATWPPGPPAQQSHGGQVPPQGGPQDGGWSVPPQAGQQQGGWPVD